MFNENAPTGSILPLIISPIWPEPSRAAAAQILVSPLALETARLESQDQQFFFSASDTNRSGCQPSAQVGRPDHQYRPGGQLQ